MLNLVIFLVVLSCAYAGQSLIKYGLKGVGAFQATSFVDIVYFLVRCSINPWVILGTVIVGCGFLGWISFLSRIDLSQALPLLAFSYIPWLLIGHFFFGEVVDAKRWVGVIFITIGVLLVAGGSGEKKDQPQGNGAVQVTDKS